MSQLYTLLQRLIDEHGSDLHVKAGAAPHVRRDGRLFPLNLPPLSPVDIAQLVTAIVPEGRRRELDERGEIDIALGLPGIGRFRVHVLHQRGSLAFVVRKVTPGLPAFEALGLPTRIRSLAQERSGLVLITGPSGSGRSTTAAMLVDEINAHRAATIHTIEDPIEVLHPDKRSIVTQREVGTDTPSFADGMRRLARVDPDVVYVGDLEDTETAQAALDAASAGVLVITTMIAASAADTVWRLLDMFSPAQQRLARQVLATSLRGVISQRLLPRADGRGRVPALEILVMTPRAVDVILDAASTPATLETVVSEGRYHGMQVLDEHLIDLVSQRAITPRDAIAVAGDPSAMKLELQRLGVVAA